MPKLIDYPRTTYAGAWELAEITDDTGGKCTVETAARKLNRKVSGSFKAIIGSAVKFGLLTSKRELLTTTTLFKRIKHAYDKQEELLFHREAFLNPPLFTQICRKFRSRELPVQMLDIMLIREFGVEEINAPGVAKAFVDGCRMVGVLDDRNIIADIDAFKTVHPVKRELASPVPSANSFRNSLLEINLANINGSVDGSTDLKMDGTSEKLPLSDESTNKYVTALTPAKKIAIQDPDAIANLFGFFESSPKNINTPKIDELESKTEPVLTQEHNSLEKTTTNLLTGPPNVDYTGYQIQVIGPGINTSLSITEEEDIAIAVALLEKIRRQLKS